MHLHNTRLQIEKFAYQKGTNVALYHAERSKTYKNFRTDVRQGLYSQILKVADYKGQLPFLISLGKAQNTTEQLLSQIAALIGQDSLADKIDLAAYLVWAGNQGGQAGLDKMGIDAVFGLKDQQVIDYFDDYSNLIIDSVDRYTAEWIANKIQEGKDEGLSPFEIQRLLEDDGLLISEIRAERITLTETAKAMNTVEQIASRKNGIQERIWRTSLDERVCPTCSPLEGEQKKIDELYSIGVLTPPAHVSCRCYEDNVIPDNFAVPDKVWTGQ